MIEARKDLLRGFIAPKAIALGLLCLTLWVGVAGCGSGSAAKVPGPSPTPTPAPTPNPAPSVSSISPSSAPAGALAFMLAVNGSNFVPASTVEWNGSSRTTTFVSSTQLQAHIMAADLASPGKANVVVVTPAPGGGSSSAASFTVAADTVAFVSSRALVGTNASGPNTTRNIWIMNPDGSGDRPLTFLTASSADSFVPSWSPDGSKIAFDSFGALDGSDALNSAANVWVMNADGTSRAPLTSLKNVAGSTAAPAWSPDGTRIACQALRALDGSDAVSANHVSNIWVMNADGSAQAPLTKLNSANSFNPVWSPDGSKIVFESDRALDGSDSMDGPVATQNIWVMNADGSGLTPLTKLTVGRTDSVSPLWSPDGNKIAFTSFRNLDGSDATNTNSTRNVWVMNADGAAQLPLTRLTANGTATLAIAWSPDGGKILFLSNRALDGSDAANDNSTRNIWAMKADGSNVTALTQLTALGASSQDGSWSPDGSKIFFDSGRALNGSNAANTNNIANIWVMNADGSGASPLTMLTAPGANSIGPTQP
jgi:Tol biopolymer transport system component